jgi:hypothetical protein
MKLENTMALSILKDIRKAYAALNADEIRSSAHQDVNIGLMASSEEGYRMLESALAPAELDEYDRVQWLRSVHRVSGEPANRFDLVLCEPGVPLPANGYDFDPATPAATAAAVVADNRHIDLALARKYPLFRKAVADSLILRVARENAMFCLVTALPNIVPSLIELPWSAGEFATDTAFLTMNQIRLALLMAAAHDRPVGYGEQKREIAAIIAGAFGWRALAREMVGKIPIGGGLIPKAAIAFGATYVVGIGLEKLNRTGEKMSRDEKRGALTEARRRGWDAVREMVPGR